MRLSVNEVQIMCQRAAAGAGLPFGLAEDSAAASAWLATVGLGGVEAFHRALEQFIAGRSVAVEPDADGQAYGLRPVLSGHDTSALFAGPALSDRISVRSAEAVDAPLRAMAVDEPLLVLACIALTRRAPTSLTIRWHRCGHSGGCEARYVNGAFSLRGDDPAALSGPGSADVFAAWGPPAEEDSGLPSLLTVEEMARTARCCYDQGIVVADEVYQRVNAHARRMLVPDSLQSRTAGAGAGLRDND